MHQLPTVSTWWPLHTWGQGAWQPDDARPGGCLVIELIIFMLRERLDLDEDNDLETLCLPSEMMIIQPNENLKYRNKLGYVIITLKWCNWKD